MNKWFGELLCAFGIKDIPVIRFIIAPGIRTKEVDVLRAHIDKAKMDPDYHIVVNYDMYFKTVRVPEGCGLLVTAPGLSAEGLKKLREHIDRAVTDPSYSIVLNYDVDVSTTPL